MESKEERARLVSWALTMTENTAIEASPYEQLLLSRYVTGELTIDRVIVMTDLYLDYQRVVRAVDPDTLKL